MVSDQLRTAWRRIPIDLPMRQRIQRILFLLFPFIFHRHPAFSEWKEQSKQVTKNRRANLLPEQNNIEPVALLSTPPFIEPPVRLIAFYLPQFYPIPENDEWWGRGFTEWNNVIRGKPRFRGHYQPHLPGELGFYDLRVPAVQHRQTELAKLYGIGGFAFYFYWFAGKRLLEGPLLQYIQDDTLDLPFCLCWANENWSRRWDGRNQELLIQQHHSPKDDLDFVAYVSKYLLDHRYIRVNGRPLIIVYRPDLLPNPKDTVRRWRTWFRKEGHGELFVAYTQSFESRDPRDYGMDAAIEFPPNNTSPPAITDKVESLDPLFQGVVFDWRVFPQRSRNYQAPDYPLFRGVNTSWDNEARRRGTGGAIFAGSTPQGYREWLENAAGETVSRISEPSERLVFVNAWNEWAEGAHLEPDQRYGYAYLQATRDALQTARFHMRRNLLVVSHDARPHGAQYLALHIARELRERLGYRVHMVILDGGELVTEYSQVANVDLLAGVAADGPEAQELARALRKAGITDAIVNTTASGGFTRPLRNAGIRVISLIHELPELIRSHKLQPLARTLGECADKIVFPAALVRDGFREFTELEDEKVIFRPQGLYKRNAKRAPATQAQARQELRQRLSLVPDSEIVIGVGYADRRKGFDLFVQAGIETSRARERAVFVWVGNLDPVIEQEAINAIADAGFLSRFFFPGHEANTDVFYAGADLYALTSREDPFPSVVLEALEVGLPVVGFEGAGGFTALSAHGCVDLVPAFDTGAFSSALTSLLADNELRKKAGAAGRALVDSEFGFQRYLFDLLQETRNPPAKISVIVPNYNYCRYLPERLASVAVQTVPTYEVIVLDDASSDGSRKWFETEFRTLMPEARVVINEQNSGCVFRQWLKGVQLARGDYVWIAEADDLAEPSFLQEALAAFADPDVVLSYTQSKQIDEEGNVLCGHYHEYVADISTEKWRNPYVSEGHKEISESLAVKNTIPNVSGVVMRKSALRDVLSANMGTVENYRVAGDWLIYVELLKLGRVAYSPEPLNLHRRHRSSVTISSFNLAQLAEIVSMQKRIRDEFEIAEGTRRTADDYAQYLYNHFGLATDSAPNVQDHPHLAKWF